MNLLLSYHLTIYLSQPLKNQGSQCLAIYTNFVSITGFKDTFSKGVGLWTTFYVSSYVKGKFYGTLTCDIDNQNIVSL